VSDTPVIPVPPVPAAFAEQLALFLRGHADPEKAVPMAAYMKNHFPFLGIRSPELNALGAQFLKAHKLPAGAELAGVVRELWLLPEREFHYTALGLLDKQRRKTEPDHIELLEELIVTDSWWDTVDMIASRLVGAHFVRYPEQIPAYTERWIAADDMWLRRTALLYQLGYKQLTDADRLFDYIRRCAEDREFFIRKAIGWALREYSKTDADAVRRFIAATALQPLSVREGLKVINRAEQRQGT
jgi:3-methyladenine DNA glycosylase AlkD